jgi:hypothetical protein
VGTPSVCEQVQAFEEAIRQMGHAPARLELISSLLREEPIRQAANVCKQDFLRDAEVAVYVMANNVVREWQDSGLIAKLPTQDDPPEVRICAGVPAWVRGCVSGCVVTGPNPVACAGVCIYMYVRACVCACVRACGCVGVYVGAWVLVRPCVRPCVCVVHRVTGRDVHKRVADLQWLCMRLGSPSRAFVARL